MVKIAAVDGSTRPGRQSRQVADWVLARAISQGGTDGFRAVENPRLIAGGLQMADVRAQVGLPFAPL